MHSCSFPDKIPHKPQQMPQVRFMRSMHKGSNQDEPTKNQETEPQRANPEISPPCFSSYKSRSGDALQKQRERSLGIWAIVSIKGDLKYPLAKFPKHIWLLIHFSVLQDQLFESKASAYLLIATGNIVRNIWNFRGTLWVLAELMDGLFNHYDSPPIQIRLIII